MKKMKKVMALLLSLVMVLAMSVVAFATEPSSPATSGTYTITINNSKTGHTYEAYQIFTGTLSDDTLSDIQWGNWQETREPGSQRSFCRQRELRKNSPYHHKNLLPDEDRHQNRPHRQYICHCLPLPYRLRSQYWQ